MWSELEELETMKKALEEKIDKLKDKRFKIPIYDSNIPRGGAAELKANNYNSGSKALDNFIFASSKSWSDSFMILCNMSSVSLKNIDILSSPSSFTPSNIFAYDLHFPYFVSL